MFEMFYVVTHAPAYVQIAVFFALLILAEWVLGMIEAVGTSAWGWFRPWRVRRNPDHFVWFRIEEEGEPPYYVVQSRFDLYMARLTRQEVWQGWRNFLSDWWDDFLTVYDDFDADVKYDPDSRHSLIGEREYRAWFAEITGGKNR